MEVLFFTAFHWYSDFLNHAPVNNVSNYLLSCFVFAEVDSRFLAPLTHEVQQNLHHDSHSAHHVVTVSPSSLTLCLFPGCRLWGRRSRGTRRGRGGERRTSSFTSWPRCCRCRAPSPASWTRPPSSGSPSATWRWETSPTRATRRGTCAWRDRRPTPPSKVGGTWRTGFVVRPD